MVESKKLHYIPQYYFKLFSLDGKTIFLYNLKKDVCRKVGIYDVCAEDYFYSRNPIVEKIFSELEGSSAILLRKIIELESLVALSNIDLNNLKFYILFQYGRTKASAILATEMANIIFDMKKPEILKFTEEKGINVRKTDIDKVKIKLEQPVGLPLMICMASGALLFDLKCVLIKNEAKIDFIFSDNPVILFDSFFNNKVDAGTTGISSRGLQIIYPINSNLLLCIYDPVFYDIDASEISQKLITKKNKDVQRLNGLQILSCNDSIFFGRKSMEMKVRQRFYEIKEKIPKLKAETRTADILSLPEGGYKETIFTSSSKIKYNLETLSFLKHKQTTEKYGVRNPEILKIHMKIIKGQWDGKIKNMNDINELIEKYLAKK
jgi:hypothetical protein